MNNDRADAVQMAIVIALPSFNVLGCSVTPILISFEVSFSLLIKFSEKNEEYLLITKSTIK